MRSYHFEEFWNVAQDIFINPQLKGWDTFAKKGPDRNEDGAARAIHPKEVLDCPVKRFTVNDQVSSSIRCQCTVDDELSAGLVCENQRNFRGPRAGEGLKVSIVIVNHYKIKYHKLVAVSLSELHLSSSEPLEQNPLGRVSMCARFGS